MIKMILQTIITGLSDQFQNSLEKPVETDKFDTPKIYMHGRSTPLKRKSCWSIIEEFEDTKGVIRISHYSLCVENKHTKM
jgi:hypothetical protein